MEAGAYGRSVKGVMALVAFFSGTSAMGGENAPMVPTATNSLLHNASVVEPKPVDFLPADDSPSDALNLQRTEFNASWIEASGQRVLSSIKHAVTQQTPGARQTLLQKEVRSFSLKEVQELARHHNLALAIQSLDVEAARFIKEQVDATFNLELKLALNTTFSKTKDRHEMITRFRLDQGSETYEVDDIPSGHTQPLEAGDFLVGQPKESKDKDQPCVIGSEGVVINSSCTDAIINNTQDEYASYASEGFSTRAWNLELSGSKLFAWGGSINAQVKSTYYPYLYPKSANVGVGKTALNLGESEWISSAAMGLVAPVPYSKQFGPLGSSQKVALETARIREKMAQERRDGQLNGTLKESLLAYWDLVGALLRVDATLEREKVSAKRMERTQRLMDLGRTTAYALIQAQAEVENIRNEEEIAWNDYIAQANVLAELLDLPNGVIPVPVGFATVLHAAQGKQEAGKAGQKNLDLAVQNRPEVRMQKLDLDVKDLNVQHRKTHLRPDASMTMSYNISESNAIYGYGSFRESLAGLGDPDARNYYIGINLSIPWGNQAVESRHAQARAEQDASRDAYLFAKVSVMRDVTDALNAMNSSLTQAGLAQVNLQLAEIAYMNAEDLLQKGRLSEFDVLLRQKEVFDARNVYTNALIASRKAKVMWLAAQGQFAGTQNSVGQGNGEELGL